MYVYNTLRDFAYYFGLARSVFLSLAVSIDGVWLVGDYLAAWFYTIAARFAYVEATIYNLSGDWLDFYYWVVDKLDIGSILDDLKYYADDLISFIRDPDYFIINLLKSIFPALSDLFSDPIGYIIETIIQYTGFDYDFIFNPIARIQAIINDAIQGIRSILDDPGNFVVGVLSNIMPDFYDFIFDASYWFERKIYDLYPDVIDFLRDPGQYLEDKFIETLENVVNRNTEGLVRVAEKILQSIF